MISRASSPGNLSLRIPEMSNFQKNGEFFFPPKCPKSISLDSGHLEKPFGPLIFQFFPCYWAMFFDRFFAIFAYFPGLGCRLIWSLLTRFGQVNIRPHLLGGCWALENAAWVLLWSRLALDGERTSAASEKTAALRGNRQKLSKNRSNKIWKNVLTYWEK